MYFNYNLTLNLLKISKILLNYLSSALFQMLVENLLDFTKVYYTTIDKEFIFRT